MKLKGTVSELLEKVDIGGSKLEQVQLSVLLRILELCGKAKVVGSVKPSGKGKPANVWELETETGLTFNVV